MATATRLMTTEELLALPDDGVYRELINGELREYPMTARGEPHCLVTHNLDYLLGLWRHQQQSRNAEPAMDAYGYRLPGG